MFEACTISTCASVSLLFSPATMFSCLFRGNGWKTLWTHLTRFYICHQHHVSLHERRDEEAVTSPAHPQRLMSVCLTNIPDSVVGWLNLISLRYKAWNVNGSWLSRPGTRKSSRFVVNVVYPVNKNEQISFFNKHFYINHYTSNCTTKFWFSVHIMVLGLGANLRVHLS